jgi:drug/metabolite transporter (DMT)-like permease
MANSKYSVALGMTAVYLIWGSTYLAIRLGVETMPPFLMTGTRFVIGGIMLYAFARLRGEASPRLAHWLPAMVLGLLMPAGGTGLVSWAEKTVPSGLAALLVAMTPMWIVLGDSIRPGGIRPNRMTIAGLALGFIGVTLLINPTGIGEIVEIDLWGALAIIVATMFWATGSIYSRHASQPKSKVLGTGMQMIAGGTGLLIGSVLFGELSGFDIGGVTMQSWMALSYLITIGSIGFAIYVWLLSVTSVTRVSTYAYVNPVVALALGNLVAGEQLSNWTLGCSVLIVIAVTIIITSKSRSPKSDDSDQTLLGKTDKTDKTDLASESLKPGRLAS